MGMQFGRSAVMAGQEYVEKNVSRCSSFFSLGRCVSNGRIVRACTQVLAGKMPANQILDLVEISCFSRVAGLFVR